MNPKPRFLLDSNIISYLVRNPQGVVTDHIIQEGEGSICTSIVVAAELRFGAEKRGSQRLTTQLETILSAIKILPMEEPSDRQYARLRYHLEKAGTPIGPNDMLIAAHALALSLTLVTANRKEFCRVSGLSVENWLELS
ncbi:MAG: type II toxin-antitoxin system VapC family toxin [Desulfobacterales bacterium]